MHFFDKISLCLFTEFHPIWFQCFAINTVNRPIRFLELVYYGSTSCLSPAPNQKILQRAFEAASTKDLIKKSTAAAISGITSCSHSTGNITFPSVLRSLVQADVYRGPCVEQKYPLTCAQLWTQNPEKKKAQCKRHWSTVRGVDLDLAFPALPVRRQSQG